MAMQAAQTFEPERLALQHNTFGFKSAADTSYDAMTANRVYQGGPLPDHSHLGNFPRPVPANLSFRPPIDRLEHGRPYNPYYNHRFSEESAGPVCPSPRDRPRCKADDETSSIRGSYRPHGSVGAMRERSSLKCQRIGDHDSRAERGCGAQNLPAVYAGHLARGQAKPQHRRHATALPSPTVCLPTIPQGSSLTMDSPVTTSQFSSDMTTLWIPSSQANTDVYSRLNPTCLPFDQYSPAIAGAAFVTTQSADLSPQSSILRAPVEDSNSSGGHFRETAERPRDSVTERRALYSCHCCSSRPKQFDTLEELFAHAAKKKYGCQSCSDRFTNKYEADRHERSLHVRGRIWSCATLYGYRQAFHESTKQPGRADVCAYCGKEFSRTGILSVDLRLKAPTDQDWHQRYHHLKKFHNFKRCNTKKFYRADHLRQHIRYSHRATLGEWTKRLENACLAEKTES